MLHDSLKERFSAYQALLDWTTHGTFLREHPLSPFAMELALGVCRRHLRLLQAIHKGTSRMPEDKVAVVLEMGLYQLFFMDSVPDHAAVSTSVEIARAASLGPGAVRLVNGFLRNSQRQGLPPLPPQNVRRISLEYSVPEWIVRRWLDECGVKEAEARAQAKILPPVQWIRVNTRRISLPELRLKLGLKGREHADRFLEVAPGREGEPGLRELLRSEAFSEGLFSVQNPAAGDVVRLLDVEPGQAIWDACAAPGGKTALLAEMHPDSTVLATDISRERLHGVEENVQRLGLSQVKIAVRDVLEEEGTELFDRILLDVPCTNMGVLSRRPEVLYRLKPEDLKTLPELQGRLLQKASCALKPGGVLVYATCSPERVETTHVIDLFLKSNPGFARRGTPVLIGTNDLGLDHFFAQALTRIA